MLREAEGQRRKTKYDFIAIQMGNQLVGIDSRVVNQIIAEALKKKQLPEFSAYLQIEPEALYSGSRIDFMLAQGAQKCLLEVKSVNVVEDGVALFPDAPTERGQKHLKFLIQAKSEGIRACVIFVVQRPDARAFAPNRAADPVFAQILREAYAKGVEIYAVTCQVDEFSIQLDKRIDVII